MYVDCDYEATIVISPVEGQLKDPDLEKQLQKNPFLDENETADYFKDSLTSFRNNYEPIIFTR